MPYYFFVWTPEIIEHLAEHDVSPEEFEEVVVIQSLKTLAVRPEIRWRLGSQ